MKDELKPEFIFSLTYNEMLIKIASGEINAKDLAKKELKARGYNKKGQWIGFNRGLK